MNLGKSNPKTTPLGFLRLQDLGGEHGDEHEKLAEGSHVSFGSLEGQSQIFLSFLFFCCLVFEGDFCFI